MESLHVAGVQHGLKIGLTCRLDGLQCRKQGILQPVAHRLPVVADELGQFTVHTESILHRQAGLHPVLHEVPPEIDMVGQERLDVLDRGLHLTPVWLVLLRLTALPLGGSLLAFLLWFLFTHRQLVLLGIAQSYEKEQTCTNYFESSIVRMVYFYVKNKPNLKI